MFNIQTDTKIESTYNLYRQVQKKQAEASPAQVSGILRTSSVSETDQSSNIRMKRKIKNT